MAGLEGFAYYKTITISNTNVDADLANFPVYVPIINDADIGGHCVGTNGYDVQFANADNSETLTFERIYWNNPAGTANGDFYVLVNPVDHDADTVIRCYYGKAEETNHSSPENTFSTTNGWAAVWHLEESGNPYLDASSNDNDSVGGTYPTQVDGKVGKGQDFDKGSSEYIQIANSASLMFDEDDDMTVSVWLKGESFVADWIIWCRGEDNQGYHLVIPTYEEYAWARFYIQDNEAHGKTYDNDLTNFIPGTWYHVVARIDRDSSTGFQIAVNGEFNEGTDPTGVGNLSHSNPLYLGCKLGVQNFFNGILDEIRISRTLRNNAFIKFEYFNSHDGHATGNELNWVSETPISGPAEPIYLIWTK